jgi:SAM-dependent MidA family methyltransferase
MHSAGLAPPVHFVETSPVLRAAQKERIPHAVWHDSLDTLPDDRPLLVAANEFFDALPIRQLVKTFSGWRERMVGLGPEGFEPVPGTVSFDDKVPDHLRTAALGSIIEAAPTAMKLARALARRLAAQGGAAIIIDYGHENYAAGDTLQALSDHAYADVFANPGGHDITAHVDFTELVRAGRGGGARVRGPVPPGQFLGLLGIAARAAAHGGHSRRPPPPDERRGNGGAVQGGRLLCEGLAGTGGVLSATHRSTARCPDLNVIPAQAGIPYPMPSQ